MAYLNHKMIDGFQIVTGFNPPNIDPMETLAAVRDKIGSTDVGKELETVGKKIFAIRQTQAELIKKAKKLDSEGAALDKDPEPNQGALALIIDKRHAVNKAYTVATGQLQAMAQAGIEIKPRMKAKVAELRKICAVRMQNKGIEECEQSTVDSLQSKLATLGPRQHLTVDGLVLDDHRRETFVYKKGGRWTTIRIEELGQVIPDGAKYPDDMTSAERSDFLRQGSVDSIKALGPDEREKRKQDALTGVMIGAGQMLAGLEMDDDSDAKAKTKAWMKTRKAEITELYDVT